MTRHVEAMHHDAGRPVGTTTHEKGVGRREVITAALAVPALVTTAGQAADAAPTSRTSTVRRWVRGPYADVRSSPSMTSSALFSRLGEAVPVAGVVVNGSWLRLTQGPMSGRYVRLGDLTTSDPSSQRVAAPDGDPFALPRVGSRVTRYVISGDFAGNRRARAAFSSPVVGSVAPRSRVSGTLVSPDWVRLDTGGFLTMALLATSPAVRGFNGQIPASHLRTLPSYLNTATRGSRSLERIAAAQFIAMDAAYHASFRSHITVEEGYRPIAWQRYWYGQYGAPRAAYPGTSNHGMGLAVDIRSDATSPFSFGRPGDRWMTANAARFGFARPWWLLPNRGNPEFWHYNFVG